MRAFFASLLAVLSFGAEVEDSWHNVDRVMRNRDSYVFLRNGQCVHGGLLSASDQEAILQDQTGHRVILRRGEILRFAESDTDARDAVFSGRSSWMDLKESGPFWRESVRIVTKTGQEFDWGLPTFSDGSIAFQGKTIAKADIRFAFYQRFKPVTEREHYLLHEEVTILAPRLWFHGLMLGRIAVLLYNSDLPEENSKLVCKS